MKETRRKPAFRVNPMEILVFAIMAVVFGNSLYQLFYDWPQVKTAFTDPRPSQSKPAGERHPASLGEISKPAAPSEAPSSSKKTKDKFIEKELKKL